MDEGQRQRLVERIWLLEQLRAEARSRAGRAQTEARRARDAAVDAEQQAADLRDRVADLGEELADLHDRLGERSQAAEERTAAETEHRGAAEERKTGRGDWTPARSARYPPGADTSMSSAVREQPAPGPDSPLSRKES